MPTTTAADAWVKTLRNAVRTTMGESGWKVGQSRAGKVFLEKVDLAPRGEKHPSVTVSLPNGWDESSVPDVLNRCRAISTVMTTQEVGLKEAARIASGASSHRVEDWSGAVDEYQKYKLLFGKRIKQKTWDQTYQPSIVKAVTMVRRPGGPKTGTELLEEFSMQWVPGTKQRANTVRLVASFLRFCVERQNFRKCWLPPAEVTQILGETNPPATPYPISNDGILELLESLEGRPDRWFTVAMLSVYGLRAEDLHHLKVQRGELWSMYRKKAGSSASTKPRQLAPLFVNGQDWNLLERFKAEERFCYLGEPGEGAAGNVLRRWLVKNPVFKRLKEEAAIDGELLKPTYCFRHRFVAEGQLRNIPPKVLAGFCGHSLQVHLGVYSKWSLRENSRDYFD